MWRSLYIGAPENSLMVEVFTNDFKVITVKYDSQGVPLSIFIETMLNW